MFRHGASVMSWGCACCFLATFLVGIQLRHTMMFSRKTPALDSMSVYPDVSARSPPSDDPGEGPCLCWAPVKSFMCRSSMFHDVAAGKAIPGALRSMPMLSSSRGSAPTRYSTLKGSYLRRRIDLAVSVPGLNSVPKQKNIPRRTMPPDAAAGRGRSHSWAVRGVLQRRPVFLRDSTGRLGHSIRPGRTIYFISLS